MGPHLVKCQQPNKLRATAPLTESSSESRQQSNLIHRQTKESTMDLLSLVTTAKWTCSPRFTTLPISCICSSRYNLIPSLCFEAGVRLVEAIPSRCATGARGKTHVGENQCEAAAPPARGLERWRRVSRRFALMTLVCSSAFPKQERVHHSGHIMQIESLLHPHP